MVLRHGYRQTEVGTIPEDWQVIAVADVCEIVVDCKNRTPPVVDGGNYAVVRTPNVRAGKFVREDLRFTNEESYSEWTVRAVPQVGDVLITREAPLGEVCLVPSDIKVCLGQRMMMYRPDPRKTASRFILYALMSQGVQANLVKKIGGSTVGHAKVDDIRFLEIPLPPTQAEQQAIAEALGDADALIEASEKLIAKKRDLKQSAMQDLFRPKASWVLDTLGDISHIKTGSKNNEDKIEDGRYPFFVRSANVERIDSYSHDCEAILIPGEGGIGSIFHYIKGRFDVHQRVYAITQFAAGISGKFVYYYMTEKFGSHAMQNSVKATVDSLRLPTFQNFEILHPRSLEEQTTIALALSDLDTEIYVLKAKLNKIRQLKQGMMHNLLTGRIRLV